MRQGIDTSQKQSKRDKCILLVEDNLLVQQVHKHFLESMGYRVKTVSTGQQALDKHKEGFDLIVLDLGLPDLDGITVCDIIRESFGDKDTPILALTTFCQDEIRAQSKAAGINHFITKPIGCEALQEVVEQWIKV